MQSGLHSRADACKINRIKASHRSDRIRSKRLPVLMKRPNAATSYKNREHPAIPQA